MILIQIYSTSNTISFYWMLDIIGLIHVLTEDFEECHKLYGIHHTLLGFEQQIIENKS